MTDDALYNFGRYFDTSTLQPGSLGTTPSLFENLSNNSNGIFSGKNFGNTMGGLGGLGLGLLGGYFANQNLKETKRNNAFYRDIMGQQNRQRTEAINSWA
jgi:hypothetical protein